MYLDTWVPLFGRYSATFESRGADDGTVVSVHWQVRREGTGIEYEGSTKWDGCSDFETCDHIHICDVEAAEDITRILRHVYYHAHPLLSSPDWERPELYDEETNEQPRQPPSQ